jgi:hypothetical protein
MFRSRPLPSEINPAGVLDHGAGGRLRWLPVRFQLKRGAAGPLRPRRCTRLGPFGAIPYPEAWT